MAVQGKPWGASNSLIIQAIKKAKGRVSHVCKALDIQPRTFYSRMDKEPEIKQALEDARNSFDLSMLDAAENTLMYALSKADEDVGNALKSTFYILNNKGKERGYNRDNYQHNDESGKHFGALMSQLAGMQKKAQDSAESDTLKSDEST